MPRPHGTNSIVLHGHLPWIQYPDDDEFLEEGWYLEALSETYLPLLAALDDLAEDGIPVRLAVGLTPPLLEMFRSPSLRVKTDRYLWRRRELAEAEVVRLEDDVTLRPTAVHYVERFSQLWQTWVGCNRDPVSAFRRHMEKGRLEVLASCATHAVLPLLATTEGRAAQVRLGVALFREVFGEDPAGFWLPECAYAPGIDEVLAAAGIQYVILDTHALTGAHPRPPCGVYRPVRTPAGIAAFGRDPTSSRQVWAAEVGYPGDPAYRELYKDLGYDGPYEHVKPWLHRDGVRRNLGIKYHRVTGKVELHEKQPYDVAAARERARVHAGNYLWNRGEQARHLQQELGEVVSITSPYDMELFGHWWYEGPWFLADIFRQMADPSARAPVRLVTPLEVLRERGSVPAASPIFSTWGEEGYLKVWLNEKNVWVLRHQQELERRMIERAREHESSSPSPETSRILDQMLRELFLVQASDWSFIITKETTVHYAQKRITDHVNRFLALEKALGDPHSLAPETFEKWAAEDSLFPGLDHRLILGGPASRPGTPLGTPPAP